jgi:hypothetical protein
LFKLKVSNLTQFFGALAKNGSFGIAKGRIVCRAKPNVPFVRLAKIVFKKCAVGKNKNTEALALESAVCWFICPVTLCLFLSFIFAVSSFRLAGNDQGFGQVGYSLLVLPGTEAQLKNKSTS